MSPPRTSAAAPRQRRLGWTLAALAVIAGAILLLNATLLRSDEGEAPPVGSAPPRIDTEPAEQTLEGQVELSRMVITSDAVGAQLRLSVLEPPAPVRSRRPLLVFLHGAGGSAESFTAEPALLSTLARLGRRAPVIALPEGRLSWWRDRGGHDWGRYVTAEVIPTVVRRFGVDPRRVAIGGISMGGFGAYHLALKHPARFCAVGGHSAGLWLDYGESYPGAFHSRADFRRNNVVRTVRRDPNAFGSTRVWNDYGDQDWFVPGNAALVEALEGGDAELTARVWPGGHDSVYWNEHWPDYLEFYAESLAACRR